MIVRRFAARARRICGRFLVRTGAVAIATLPVALTVGPAGASLSAADQALVSRVETYLNNIRTLTARFIQAETNGWIAEGSIFISRPGRLRIEYAPPHRFLVVSTGRMLILYNGERDQVTHLPMSVSPAAFLLKPRIDLTRSVLVQRVVRRRDTFVLTVASRGGSRQGRLRLVFNRDPFGIKEWTVIDKRRKETRIILVDKRIGVPIPKSRFLFSKPGKPGAPRPPGRPEKVIEETLPAR